MANLLVLIGPRSDNLSLFSSFFFIIIFCKPYLATSRHTQNLDNIKAGEEFDNSPLYVQVPVLLSFRSLQYSLRTTTALTEICHRRQDPCPFSPQLLHRLAPWNPFMPIFYPIRGNYLGQIGGSYLLFPSYHCTCKLFCSEESIREKKGWLWQR